ncbi:transporter substrate-binding domain-containing protein [Prosthecobacter sp.]|uniref:transporter substrate-binding domain-containing protein n=1 Tax=Prosthecobacter sp. TaxID=1965333 RepID=UPI003783D3DA
MRAGLVILSALALISFLSEAAGQAPAATTSGAKIRVVTRDLEPFSFEKEGRRVGYAAELWEQLAREAKLDYEVKVVESAKDIIDALKNKTADVGVGAISVTSTREEVIDFSQPFYESGLQVLVSGSNGSFADNIFALVGNLFNIELIGAFALLMVTMFIISHLVWRYEHKINGDMWPEDYRKGMWESFWWTISTLLVGGADNKGPVGVGGRIVAIVWMLLSIVLVSLLTASFTTTLTINTLKGDINGPGDLPGRRVATVQGSTTETWLNKRGAKTVPLATVTDCVLALKKGEVAAVVYDAPVLQYEAGKLNDDKLQMVGPVFDRQNYAFALQQDSPLRERLNQALLKLSEQGVGNELRTKFFGEDK